MGLPAVHKDLSLISLLPKWSGANLTVTLEEVLSSVESAAKIANWDSNDCRQIAALKLVDAAKTFHNTCGPPGARGHMGDLQASF
jgi:hypothetical protein